MLHEYTFSKYKIFYGALFFFPYHNICSLRTDHLARWESRLTGSGRYSIYLVVLGRDQHHHHHHHRHTIIAMSERRKQARSSLRIVGQATKKRILKARWSKEKRASGRPRRPGRSCEGETPRVIELPGRTGVAQVRWGWCTDHFVCVYTWDKEPQEIPIPPYSPGPVKSLSRSKIGRRRGDARLIKLLNFYMKSGRFSRALIYRHLQIADLSQRFNLAR